MLLDEKTISYVFRERRMQLHGQFLTAHIYCCDLDAPMIAWTVGVQP